MRWSRNATMNVYMEAEIEYPANRMITPQATGGPKRKVISGATGNVNGIGGVPNQPAAGFSNRGRRETTVPAASPTSRSRPATKVLQDPPATRPSRKPYH